MNRKYSSNGPEAEGGSGSVLGFRLSIITFLDCCLFIRPCENDGRQDGEGLLAYDCITFFKRLEIESNYFHHCIGLFTVWIRYREPDRHQIARPFTLDQA